LEDVAFKKKPKKGRMEKRAENPNPETKRLK
jgi:hypothetical protein